MTLPEFAAAMDADVIRRRRSFQVATVSAWQTARLMRTDPKKRLPKLSKLFEEFSNREESENQSPRQMRAVLQTLRAQGFPIRKVVAHG